MQKSTIKIIKWIFILAAIITLLIIYAIFDPDNNIYFPKCPFNLITGFDCPGCGSQRAVHHLMNFNILEALKANALLVLSIPYIITGYIFELIKKPGKKFLKWRKILFGEKTIYIILVIIIAFWILRNISF